MRKTREQKGITLIALIITIVVLLILAVVAINSIQNDGIISKANEVANKYNQSVQNEADTLQNYVDYLNQYIGGGSALGDATVGEKTTKLSTINGEAYSSNNPVIPAGFIPINTTATTGVTNWDATNLEAEVKKGLVITDSVDSNGVSNGNEFVWIPVETISEMASVTGVVDGKTNYQGVLYDFSKESDGTLKATANSTYVQGTNNYREPANLTYNDGVNDYADKASRFTTLTWNENYYQETFNKMVESVAKYKGFYVGRYEMSYNTTTNKAQSKAGESSVYNSTSENNWWGLYQKAKTYSNSGVISEMIWGCQYDAMMRWMQKNGIDVTSSSPADTNRNNTQATYNSDTNRITGASTSNDILNNVYDLLGNSYEWTQEASSTVSRVNRGGSYYSGFAPKGRGSVYCPTNTNGYLGSRLTLYVGL